jgi:putative tricarboxylic transport membrane protein
MVLFAAAAVGLRLLDFPMAPMLLGFILGGMMEENLRRALAIYNDSWVFLWERGLTLSILIIAALVLFVPMIGPRVMAALARRREAAGEGG